MRRTCILALAVFALLGVVTPNAYAQAPASAPAPTFRLNGLVDNLTTWSRNVSNVDGDFGVNDKQWYGRTRGRFDFIGEYGKAKAVLGIELDFAYGQTGSNDSTIVNAGPAATTPVAAQFGTDGSFDLNTDTRGIIEIKWLYTEFEAPFIPVPTLVRLGAQPFGALASYKLATYANGDFPGVYIGMTFTPNVRLELGYIAVEERLVGTQHGQGITLDQIRGDDWSAIVSPSITPFKGLDIKPMYSYFFATGTTSSQARQGRGGVNTSTNFTNPVSPGCNTSTTGPCSQWGINENRSTVGIDARWRSGPFSLDPSILYQFGDRHAVATAPFVDSGRLPGKVYNAGIDAWLIDIRAGYQIGPLLLEGLAVWSTGNSTRNDTFGKVRYFQPLDTDTSYLADWGTQLSTLGVDYLNAWNEAGAKIAYPGSSIGYDKYGRKQLGLKATYAWTPTLSMSAGATYIMTDTGIGSHSTAVAGAGLLPNFKSPGGKEYYVGTDLFLSASWRFAPGLTWDNAFGYMLAGNAQDPGASNHSAKDSSILTSRIRFTF
jgi:hypothetical protein